MRKESFFICIVFVIIAVLSSCSQEKVVDNSIDAYIEQNEYCMIVQSKNLKLNCFKESEKYYVFCLKNQIIIIDKSNNSSKCCLVSDAKNCWLYDDYLYYMSTSLNRIYFYDIKNESYLKDYVSTSRVNYYYPLNNGKIVIQEETNDNELTVSTEKIYDPFTNTNFSVDDSKAYYGGDYCIPINYIRDEYGIYYHNSFFKISDYIIDSVVVNDKIYYSFGYSDGNKANIYYFNQQKNREDILCTFDLNNKRGAITETFLEMYSYKDKLYVLLGLNEKSKTKQEYDGYQFIEIDSNGSIVERYSILKDVDNTYFNFFDNRVYYYDGSGVLNSFEL